MAELDFSIIARLIDGVTAPARGVAGALRNLKAQADNLARAYDPVTTALGASLRFFQSIERNTPKIEAAFATMSRGWDMMKHGASLAYSRVTTLVRGMISGIQRLGLVFGVTAGGIGYLFHNWAMGINELQEMTNQMGISTNVLRAYQFAAEKVGISQGRLNTALNWFAKQLAELQSTGKGQLAKYLESTGRHNVVEALKASKDTEEALGIYLGAMHGAKDIAAMSTRAFGLTGAPMIRLAEPETYEEFKKFLEYAGIITPEHIKVADEYRNALANLRASWEGLKNAVGVSGAMQPITDFFQWLADYMKAHREDVAKFATMVSENFTKLTRVLVETDWTAVGARFKKWIIDPLLSVKDAFGGWTNLAIALTAMYLARPVFEMFGGFIIGLKGANDLLVTFASALSEAFGGEAITSLGTFYFWAAAIAVVGYELYKNWDRLAPAWERVKTAVEPLTEALKDLWEAIGGGKWPETGQFDILGWFGGEAVVQTAYDVLNGLANVIERIVRALSAFTTRGFLAGMQQLGIEGWGLTKDLGNYLGSLFTVLPDTWLSDVFGAGPLGTPSTRVPPPTTAPSVPTTPPTSLTPGTSLIAPMSAPGGSPFAGTNYYSALESAISDLQRSKPSELAAHGAVGGVPPTGITIQARGPSVNVTQAPPNVNVSVSVNVMRPDETPIATATAVGHALGRQLAGSMFDHPAEST